MSAAVLFYGYNLGGPQAPTGWALRGSGPDWLAGAEDRDKDYGEMMRRTILLASGVPEGEIAPNQSPGLTLNDLLAKHCGVRLLMLGQASAPIYGLALADAVYWAENWTPQSIMPTTRCASRQPLTTALEALGMKPVQNHPSWILAPDEF